MSQALIDLQITHEELKTIMNEKERYEQMKENIRNIKTNDELSEHSSINKKNIQNTQIEKFFCINQCLTLVLKIINKNFLGQND